VEVEIWEGGLQAQEIEAIEKLKKAFSKKTNATNRQDKSMYPWKGYAGFRFVDHDGYEGEFDLVIVTHCNVLIIELKDWNNAEVLFKNGKWYKNDREMGRSPVSVTRNKKFLLDNRLKPFKHRFTNKGYAPFVDFFVVMTGNADFSQLPGEELRHTLSLNEFIELSDQRVFNSKFKPHPDAQVLNRDFKLFDELFLGKNTEPKKININGYKANELIFEHPNKVYKEFQAISEVSKQDEALLRIWNFNKLEGLKANTQDGRYEIVSRERTVLQFIKHHHHELYKHCLRSLTSVQKDQITTEYSEIYEIPPEHERFNKFIGKYGHNFSENDRINIVKLLISKFSDLHEIKVAHRDIGDHSLWISPAKEVALSNFISAYHQPVGTVGDYRKLLSVNDAVEQDSIRPNNKNTPYQDDVQRLALISWHILTNQRISKSSLESATEQLKENNSWYSAILLNAFEGQYQSAQLFFEALKSSEPDSAANFAFDDGELEIFRHAINHNRQFREDGDFVVETDEKEVYFSGNTLVKAWLNVAPNKENPALGYKVLHFLRSIEKICSVAPKYLPTIREFGIATKSSSLYLTVDRVEGKHWDQLEINNEDKIVLIEQLIATIDHLHGLGFSHGDLHPKNILILFAEEKYQIILIDMPDFSLDQEEPKNHLYSPDNIDNCSAFERDNFAVMRLSCDLLGIKWGEASELYPSITDAIQTEITDIQYGFKDLERFKRSINENIIETQKPVEVLVRGNFQPITIYPDNGHLYLQLERSKKKSTDIRVRAVGIGGSVDFIYSSTEKNLTLGFPPRVRDTVKFSDADSSQVEIDFPIKISPDTKSDLSNLDKELRKNDAFLRALELVLKPDDDDYGDSLTDQLKEAFRLIDVKNEAKDSAEFKINTAELWQAILDTEKESHPYIEVGGDIVGVQGRIDQLIVPYNAENDLLGKFNSSDCIEAYKIDGEKDVILGEVVLKLSSLNEIRLTKIRQQTYNLNEGDFVYFRSKQDQASYVKRKAALKRLLDREAVISEIFEYFDSSCKNPTIDFSIEVTDHDFRRYDRIDDHGNQISLNSQQKDAFKKIIQNGPISLLQGPPGTGKTEFIAAFVHYLIEKQQVQRILLVSQSHEAVNTAAERIRKHCSRLNTQIDVVRFSNREGAVSTGLKDVFSDALVTEKRELFRAEVKYRVESLSQALGVQAEYLSELVCAELKIFKQIDNFWSAMNALSQATLDNDDKEQIKKTISELDSIIRDTLINQYDINVPKSSDLSSAKQWIIDKLNRNFSISPDEAKKANALGKLSKDMLDVLETDRVNYDEFFARSRQLVTGTCVGIGQHHIGIQNNQYDWVIIDEAARSIASELAIAMQSGKRILLVGDHQQLPPLYTDEHKKALARKLGIAAKDVDLDSVLQSDFARAFDSPYGQQAGATLLTQYRMAPQIGDIVSTIFYKGKLVNGDRAIPEIYHNAPYILENPVTWLDTSAFGNKCYHQNDRGFSIYNRCEADLIIELLKNIAVKHQFIDALKSLVKYDEPAIGIICMYAEQKRLIRQKFKENIWPDDFKKLVKIDTVDSYQGKENRIIVLSVTCADKTQNPKFLRAPNRINVALSRAMDRLVIVGSADMWRSRNKDLPLGQVLKLMQNKSDNSGYKFYDGTAMNSLRKK